MHSDHVRIAGERTTAGELGLPRRCRSLWWVVRMAHLREPFQVQRHAEIRGVKDFVSLEWLLRMSQVSGIPRGRGKRDVPVDAGR